MLVCTLDREQVLFKVFEIYDADGSGELSHGEFLNLSTDVQSSSGTLFPGNFAAFVDGFDQNNDGMVDFREFMLIDHQFPMVFYPAFQLQEQLWRKTIGKIQWGKLTKRFDDAMRKRIAKSLFPHEAPRRTYYCAPPPPFAATAPAHAIACLCTPTQPCATC